MEEGNLGQTGSILATWWHHELRVALLLSALMYGGRRKDWDGEEKKIIVQVAIYIYRSQFLSLHFVICKMELIKWCYCPEVTY